MTKLAILNFCLTPEDNEQLANLCGSFDAHLRQIELAFNIEIDYRGHIFQVTGEEIASKQAQKLIENLYLQAEQEIIDPQQIQLMLQEVEARLMSAPNSAAVATEISIKVKRGTVKGRGNNQKKYLQQIANRDLCFGIGPAGTGKTYLAVASAVEALQQSRVQRIILTRPAVEAGERLGFLPGDLTQKVDPYLRPLYDALYEMMGAEKVARLMERHVIEIAPLAFMRGRTLNDAFIILDEAQNTTTEQMKMFLTRIGFGSVAVVTGDITQIDLPRHLTSGLKQALQVLKSVEEISFTFFTSKDVVRHPLVKRIVEAYDAEIETRADKSAVIDT